jgi:hypothetical protein
MPDPIGYRRWAIAEGRLRDGGSETACILNASDDDANVALTVYYADREPTGPYLVCVAARRTLHLRLDQLDDPEPIEHDCDYASVLESDVPVVVQYSRVEPCEGEASQLTTIAYAGD